MNSIFKLFEIPFRSKIVKVRVAGFEAWKYVIQNFIHYTKEYHKSKNRLSVTMTPILAW